LRFVSIAAFVLAAITALPLAQADGTVNVVLQDATSGSGITGMNMTATPDSVIAGRVTIRAANQSQGLVHEVIVVGPVAKGAKLPYNEKTGLVIESRSKTSGRFPTFRPASRAH
jgi:uncharacterized cupredoxin-like copper-binding protein